MIRINLLPSDKKKRARRVAPSPMPSGDLSLGAWGAVYAGAIAVWLVVLGILYFAQSGEMDTVAQENKTLEARRLFSRRASTSAKPLVLVLSSSRRASSVLFSWATVSI